MWFDPLSEAGGLQLQAEYEFEKHSTLRLAYCPNLLATIQEIPT